MPHRVFHDPPPIASPSDAFDALRDFMRSLGLVEHCSGEVYIYECLVFAGRRQFATLSGGRSRATLYLYPDALGHAPGHAAALYRTLDDAGLDMGSKAGPSIGVSLSDGRQLTLLRDGLAALFDS